jgi:hypothetical protein
MTEQDQDTLEQFINRLIDERLVSEPTEPHFLIKLKNKLHEQGTQRGLMLLLPIILNYWFQLDHQTTLDVVTGILTIYGVHNVVTDG